MWDDPIVDEIHKTREKILKENNYDINKIFKKHKEYLDILKNKGCNIITKNNLKDKIKVS